MEGPRQKAPPLGGATGGNFVNSGPQKAADTQAVARELTPARFFQIAAQLQARERRRRDSLPVISRVKTVKGGL